MDQNPRALEGNQKFPLPISKLRGLSARTRHALKRKRITTCGQLIFAAATSEQRRILSQQIRVNENEILKLVQRADLSRVNGIGIVFCDMLQAVGVNDVADLANQEAKELQAKLNDYNAQFRLARRSPTPEEATDFVEQARDLGKALSY